MIGLYKITYNQSGTVKDRKKILIDKLQIETCEEGQHTDHSIISMAGGYIFSVDIKIERLDEIVKLAGFTIKEGWE